MHDPGSESTRECVNRTKSTVSRRVFDELEERVEDVEVDDPGAGELGAEGVC